MLFLRWPWCASTLELCRRGGQPVSTAAGVQPPSTQLLVLTYRMNGRSHCSPPGEVDGHASWQPLLLRTHPTLNLAATRVGPAEESTQHSWRHLGPFYFSH